MSYQARQQLEMLQPAANRVCGGKSMKKNDSEVQLAQEAEPQEQEARADTQAVKSRSKQSRKPVGGKLEESRVIGNLGAESRRPAYCFFYRRYLTLT